MTDVTQRVFRPLLAITRHALLLMHCSWERLMPGLRRNWDMNKDTMMNTVIYVLIHWKMLYNYFTWVGWRIGRRTGRWFGLRLTT